MVKGSGRGDDRRFYAQFRLNAKNQRRRHARAKGGGSENGRVDGDRAGNATHPERVRILVACA